MKVFLFTLHIIIWNYDTGEKLWDYSQTVEASNIKECYRNGVSFVLPIVNGIRTYIFNASANVSCEPVEVS